jgi:hypothetical protein
MANDNTENESSGVSDDVEESETGYSTGTGSSASGQEEEESVTNSSRRTTTEVNHEEETTDTTASDDNHKESIAPMTLMVPPPIQPIKVTSIAKTSDVGSNMRVQLNVVQPEHDKLQTQSSEKNSTKSEPPSISYMSRNDESTSVAAPNLNMNTESPNRSRNWFLPFAANRRSQEQHNVLNPGVSSFANPGVNKEYTNPATSSAAVEVASGRNDASPSRTLSFSDSGTPDRPVEKTSPVATSSAAIRCHEKNMTAAQQHGEGVVVSNALVYPLVHKSASVRCMVIAVFAALLTVVLSTIGTSYLGADLALRGYKVSDSMDSNIIPSMNDTAIPPMHNDSVLAPPTGILTSSCSSGNVLVSLEIVFDSKPAEVGISLKESSDIAGTDSGIWLFQALSFRSFTQFQRMNTFSVCLSNTSTYEFEITDTSGNGLVSTFGASTQIYGNWTIRLDSLVVANYFGDCNATTVSSTNANGNSSIIECGDYCRCLFNVSKNSMRNGGCTSICS